MRLPSNCATCKHPVSPPLAARSLILRPNHPDFYAGVENSHLSSLPCDVATCKKSKTRVINSLHLALLLPLHVCFFPCVLQEATRSHAQGRAEAPRPWQRSLKRARSEQLGNYIIAVEYESTGKLQGYCLTSFLLDSVLWDLKTASDMVSRPWMIRYFPT